ncbi:MAG: riboflavin biosynthesis protein RibF [Clostridia bacterium]|nr:riboflavin biosynthesis protein RibF [Clostridia bacterium]
MRIFSLPCTALPTESKVIALGCFDGTHLGHEALFRVTVAEARRQGAIPSVFTFSDFLPQKGAPLSTLDGRLEGMARCGIEAVFLCAFSDVKGLSPEEFIEKVLKNTLGAVSTVCGFNYRFGAGAKGDSEALRAAFPEAKQVPAVTYDGSPISSTRIRAALENGKVEEAHALLGRPYSVTGEVSHGKGAGHLFGFPTANVAVPTLLPARGVYETRVTVDGESYVGLSDVGIRPTLENGGEERVESFLLDFSGDLYGKRITISFLRRLRDEKRFENPEALRTQIEKDVKTIKNR